MASRPGTCSRHRWQASLFERSMLWVLGFGLVVAACSTNGNRDEVGVRASGGAAELGGVSAVAVVSGKDSSGWLLSRVESKAAVSLFKFSTEDLELVAELPNWKQGIAAMAFDGGVLVGGVRCASSACADTVAELLVVDPSGTVEEFATVDEHGGSPDDTDVVDLVGTSSAGVWVRDFEGRLTAFDRAGSPVVGPLSQFGEPCVIGSDLYLLQPEGGADSTAASSGPAEDITAEGKGFGVWKWDGKQLSPVEDGQLEAGASPGPNGFCAGGGFEVPGPARVARWTPGASWRETVPVSPPQSAETGIALSSSARSYVVDSSGTLVELANGRASATSVRFSTVRGDRPPLGLVVDDAYGMVVACVQDFDEKTATNSVECEVQ